MTHYGWGTWAEDRRYVSKGGDHWVVVSKRVDGGGKTYWKNERRRLSREERWSIEAALKAARTEA